jgi:hypothetical protein
MSIFGVHHEQQFAGCEGQAGADAIGEHASEWCSGDTRGADYGKQ